MSDHEENIGAYCWLMAVSMQFGSGMKIYAKY